MKEWGHMKKRIFLKNVTELTLEEGFEKFINNKIALKKSQYTIDFYEERFLKLCDYLKNEKNIRYTNEISEDDIIDYILYKRSLSPNIADSTINNHLRAIRAVLYYFMEKGYTTSFYISLVTVKQIPKEGYTQDEQLRLIQKPDIDKCSFSEYRNWVIICHLLASGNRARTIRYIKNKHVNFQEKVIVLEEVKNKEGYEMPISDEYFPILKEYMKIRGGEPEDYLFSTQYGTQLTEGGLRSVMSKYNQKHGVDKTSIHRFRNTFAKQWLLKGGSAKRLQHALGHKNSKMVDEYARLYGRELKEDFSKYTPLSDLKEEITEKKKIGVKKK